MKNVAGRDAAVHVLAEGIGPVLSLRDPQVKAFDPDLIELFPEPVEDLTAEAGLD